MKKDKPKTISLSEPSKANVNIFFEEMDELEQDKGPDEAFEMKQEEFSFVEEISNPSTNIESEKWSIKDILQDQ
ncbi:1364_t:CDS:2 [Cetraspora pellucida]|uniref:1364_t:CDS:1 n=1 Tax=Cetraspora pellucida TaxID=1433469 RepID=A0ACA9N284_9GLOM|nr:1364_t:CDS:2 [Cetraspora pellucida]